MAAAGGFFDDLGESLQQEALSEMADSFFGARRLIEDELDLLHETLHELNAIAERALDRLCLLHSLLVDQPTTQRFYNLLQCDLGHLPRLLEGRSPRLSFPLPGGLRWSNRYQRLFELAYTFAQDACSGYLHGKQRGSRKNAPGGGGVSLHYHQILQWCEAMNKRIAHINASQPPSVVMAYARMLRGNSDQAQAFGATLGNIARNEDATMGLPLLRCEAIGIGPLPSLPSPARASDVLRDFAKQAYAAHGPELREFLRSLEAQREESLRQWNARLN